MFFIFIDNKTLRFILIFFQVFVFQQNIDIYFLKLPINYLKLLVGNIRVVGIYSKYFSDYT